jgi:hypothetical protein
MGGCIKKINVNELIKKEEIDSVTGGITQEGLALDIPESAISKMRSLTSKLSSKECNIDMFEPAMGCESCGGGCEGCSGCRGQS